MEASRKQWLPLRVAATGGCELLHCVVESKLRSLVRAVDAPNHELPPHSQDLNFSLLNTLVSLSQVVEQNPNWLNRDPPKYPN